jgi:hypothetical protein
MPASGNAYLPHLLVHRVLQAIVHLRERIHGDRTVEDSKGHRHMVRCIGELTRKVVRNADVFFEQH